MTKNEDEKLVTKGAVKRILKKIERQDHVTIQGLFSDLQEAIDKLPAVPQGKDCVEQEEVLCQIENLTSIESGGVSFFSRVQVRNVIAKLPPVLPAVLPNSRQASLKGDSWVLEELKEYLKGKVDAHLVGVRNLITNLEFDAPKLPAIRHDWVLKKLKECLAKPGEFVLDTDLFFKTNSWAIVVCGAISKKIGYLESQAPVSEFAEQVKEDRRKAEAWKKLYSLVKSQERVVGKEFACEINSKEMDDLLAQSEIPPKAEET